MRQLGAGGAGAAVANALLSLGVRELVIAGVELDRAKGLASRLNEVDGQNRVSALRLQDAVTLQFAGIVNTTPIGMVANPQPAIDTSLITNRLWVADIVCFPLETELLRIARERGCPMLNGSGMVVGQAARAFEIFTGSKANKARMANSFTAG